MNTPRGVAAVRKRPGMYLGPFDGGIGPNLLVEQAVGCAIEEALTFRPTQIWVRLDADGSCSVEDNGRGLPTAPCSELGISYAEAAVTLDHVTPAFHANGPVASYCTVNALSETLELRVWRDGEEHRMTFRRGERETGEVLKAEPRDKHGTMVKFVPDRLILGAAAFDGPHIATKLQELARQYGVTIGFDDRRQLGKT